VAYETIPCALGTPIGHGYGSLKCSFVACWPDFIAPVSGRARGQAAELDETAHVVGKVLHPDLGLGADHADRAHQSAAHVIGLRAEHMLDAHTYRGFGPVAALGQFSQRLAALALAVNVALELLRAQLRLRLLGPIGGIRLHARAGIALHQQVIHCLAVMQGGIADMVAPHQLVGAVHVHVVLVAVMALAMFLGPARINVLL